MSVSSCNYFSECIFGVVWRFACSCSHMFTKRLQALGVVGSEASVDNGKRAITQLHRRFSTFLHHPPPNSPSPSRLISFWQTSNWETGTGGREVWVKFAIVGVWLAALTVQRQTYVCVDGDVLQLPVTSASTSLGRKKWLRGVCGSSKPATVFANISKNATALPHPPPGHRYSACKQNESECIFPISKSQGRHLSAVSRTSRGRECSWECQIKWEVG